MTQCQETRTPLQHPKSTYSTINMSSESYRSEKTNDNVESPATTVYPVYTQNTTTQRNVTLNKFTKPSSKKVDLHFSILTTKNTTKENKETVISQINTTYMNNVTDNQLLNTSFNAINCTNNLTYLGEEINNNQSLSQNSQIIDIEEDEDLDLSEENLSAAGITGITLGCVVVVGIICGISFFLYRTRGFNRPQVLNDHCSNPDSSGYIDDASVRVSVGYFLFALFPRVSFIFISNNFCAVVKNHQMYVYQNIHFTRFTFFFNKLNNSTNFKKKFFIS